MKNVPRRLNMLELKLFGSLAIASSFSSLLMAQSDILFSPQNTWFQGSVTYTLMAVAIYATIRVMRTLSRFDKVDQLAKRQANLARMQGYVFNDEDEPVRIEEET